MKDIIFQKIVNKLITELNIDISNINDKAIDINLQDIGVVLSIYCNNNKILINNYDNVDVKISLKFSAFISLINDKNINDLIREDKITIIGETKIAQSLIDILKTINLKNKIREIFPDCIIDLLQKTKKNIINNNFKNKVIAKIINPEIIN